MHEAWRADPGAGRPDEWPLCGRDEELALALDAVRSGPGLVLGGRIGVGKSRLAAAVVEHLRADGRSVERIGATRSAAMVPYGVFAPLFEVSAPDDPVKALRGVRERLVDALGAAMPVLFVDDAHLIDPASAALLHQLVGSDDVGLLVTVRTGTPTPDAVTALWKDDGLVRLDLPDLSRADAGLLVEAGLGGPVNPDLRNDLWRATSGNPLALHETVLEGLRSGRLIEEDGVWRWEGPVVVAGRLVDVIEERLARLEPQQRDFLALLSLADPMPLPLVDALDAMGVAGELEREGSIVVEAAATSTVRFAHPVFGEIVRAGLGTFDLIDAHRRLLGATDPSSSDSLQRAVWTLAAGPGGTLDDQIVLEASQAARRRGDLELAERVLELGDPTAAEVAVARAELAFDRRSGSGVHEALAMHEAAVLPPGLRLRVLIVVTSALAYLDDDAAAALAAGEQMLELDFPEDDRAFAVAHLGCVAALTGNPDEATRLLAQIGPSPTPAIQLRAFPATNLLHLGSGRIDDAIDEGRVLLGEALAHADVVPEGAAWVGSALGTALLMGGRLDDLDGLLGLARAAGLADAGIGAAFVELIDGRLALARGHAAIAAVHLRRAVSGFEHGAFTPWTAWAGSLLAECLVLLGDAGEAAIVAAAHRRDTLLLPAGLDAARAVGWVQFAMSGESAGLDAMAEAAEIARSAGQPVPELMALFDGWRIRPDRAEVDRIEALAQTLTECRWAAPIAAIVHGHAGADLDLVEEGVGLLEAMGADLFAAEGAARGAESAGVALDRARSARLSARSAVLRGRCGSVSTPALEARTATPLTAREADVARLAADGLTSQEIADRFGSSRRTVDNQLGSVYVKLGVRGRADLPAAMRSSS